MKKQEKKKKKSSKSKKQTIIIRARKKVTVSGVDFYDICRTAWAQFKPNQKYERREVLSAKLTSSITSIFLTEGRPTVHASITLHQLERFFEELKKDLPELRRINSAHPSNLLGLRHLAPDLSLAVYKKDEK